VAPPPFEPAGGVAGRPRTDESVGEQPPDLGDGERNEAGIGRWRVGAGRRRGLGAGPVPEPGGGNCADREGGHDEYEVAQDRGVEPGLALVQAEAALWEPEAFSTGQRSPAALIRRALDASCPSGT
jgi:hypothetical protein